PVKPAQCIRCAVHSSRRGVENFEKRLAKLLLFSAKVASCPGASSGNLDALRFLAASRPESSPATVAVAGLSHRKSYADFNEEHPGPTFLDCTNNACGSIVGGSPAPR